MFQRCNADHFIPLVQVRRVHQLPVVKMTAKYFKVSSHILCQPMHSKTGDTLCCQAIELLCPRPVGGALSGDRRPSVCLMSRTSALTRKPKGLGRRNFAHGYPRSHATPTPIFKVKRSKVKVTGSISAAQRNVPIFRKRIKLRPSNLVRT